MNGLVGGPLLVECLGLDPPALPLKSGPEHFRGINLCFAVALLAYQFSL